MRELRERLPRVGERIDSAAAERRERDRLRRLKPDAVPSLRAGA
jgi:hypothetical protein